MIAIAPRDQPKKKRRARTQKKPPPSSSSSTRLQSEILSPAPVYVCVCDPEIPSAPLSRSLARSCAHSPLPPPFFRSSRCVACVLWVAKQQQHAQHVRMVGHIFFGLSSRLAHHDRTQFRAISKSVRIATRTAPHIPSASHTREQTQVLHTHTHTHDRRAVFLIRFSIRFVIDADAELHAVVHRSAHITHTHPAT